MPVHRVPASTKHKASGAMSLAIVLLNPCNVRKRLLRPTGARRVQTILQHSITGTGITKILRHSSNPTFVEGLNSRRIGFLKL